MFNPAAITGVHDYINWGLFLNEETSALRWWIGQQCMFITSARVESEVTVICLFSSTHYKVYQTFRACTTAFRISAEGESTTADNTATTWSFSLMTELRACGCVATVSRHWSTRSCFGMYAVDNSSAWEHNIKRLGTIIPTNFVTWVKSNRIREKKDQYRRDWDRVSSMQMYLHLRARLWVFLEAPQEQLTVV